MSSTAPRRHSSLPALAVLAFAIAGCGGTDKPAPRTSVAGSGHVPTLLSAPREPGELVLHGEASPATHGPFALHGRYRVRFAQYAPEDPRLDFGAQTAFVAALRPGTSPRSRSIRLFRAAAAGGSRRLRLDGRYRVEIAFGDFPYVVRFTPAPRVPAAHRRSARRPPR
jgi:hypothetical protein